ncbi:hypothetical protein [Pandoraea bronchicola]|uniref:Uncharacterized protein n=1 Tax=Pandoraea bronchicola TaxID=2508287 RepID=A0A5E5BX29_9BURK|nr:hypothetical protein [Pandoraea bronchicola]VVE88883.1 hypothetical protein PBR20603_02846 [Pandoraea bronchicola]
MDINACPPGGIASGSFSATVPRCEGAPPEAVRLAAFGPVTGHDGSGAPLPGVGPHDFSLAQPVYGAASPRANREVVHMWSTPRADAAQFVVRACPSAWCATQSWLASRLCGALGLATPTALLVRGCSLAFDGTHAPERLYLATTYLPAYRALGQWLEGDAAWRVIDGGRGGAGDACKQARHEAREIGWQMEQRVANAAQARADAQAYAAIVKARNDRRAMLCRALPDVYQCALERHYIAALWLGNRDLCNASMGNIGVWRDKNDLPYIMTVDFSTCLGLAVQGEREAEGDGVVRRRGQAFASLGAPRCPGRAERSDTSHYGSVILEGALADLTQFRHGEYCAPFARRLSRWTCAADSKTALDELKDPTGVRALAAEMAYRLARIGAPDILPWAASASDIARALPAGNGSDRSTEDPDSQVHRILSRRDCLVTLLGGKSAAQAWEQLYPTRAAAIKAQQSPFLTPEREA